MRINNLCLNRKISDVTVLLTTGCTMSCKYCFEHQRDHSKDTMMNPSTFIDIIEHHVALGTKFDLSLFGGEPTLNKPCLKALVEYLESNKSLETPFFIHIQTNAYDIDDEILEILRDISVSSPCGLGICVSIDSTTIEGNIHRVNHDGDSTWSTVYNNIIRIHESVPGAYIDTHSVFTNENAPFFAQTVMTLKKMVDEGIIAHFGMNWVDPDTIGFNLSEEAVDTVLNQYWNTIYPSIKSDNWTEETISSFMVMGLDTHIPLKDDPIDNSYNVCSAGSTSIAYIPDGTMIPCHKFIDKRAENLILDISEFPPKKEDISGDDNYPCIECPLKHGCQTCIASNIMYGGHIHQQSKRMCKRKLMIYKKMMKYKLQNQQKILNELISDNTILSDEIKDLTIKIGESLITK